MDLLSEVQENVRAAFLARLELLISDYRNRGVEKVLVWWAFSHVRKALGSVGWGFGGTDFIALLRQLESSGKVKLSSLDGQRPVFEILGVKWPMSGPFWGSPVSARPMKLASSNARVESSSSSSRSDARRDRFDDPYRRLGFSDW